MLSANGERNLIFKCELQSESHFQMSPFKMSPFRASGVFQDFELLTEVFAPGRPPGHPRGRPRDILPQNLLFGLLFRS